MTGHAPQLCSCGNHELHDVSAIGDWTHGVLGARRSQPKTVRAIAETEPIWSNGDLPRDQLTEGIAAAGGIACEHALLATTLADGHVDLGDGVHRWAVASELGIERAPVRMAYEPREPVWAWPPQLLLATTAARASGTRAAAVGGPVRRGDAQRPERGPQVYIPVRERVEGTRPLNRPMKIAQRRDSCVRKA